MLYLIPWASMNSISHHLFKYKMFSHYYQILYPQAQFVEDGARATPNTSLTDEEKLKICLEQLKEKEEEIVDLNGQISALKEDKRSFKNEITMLKARVSSKSPPHDVVLAQIEELTREQQEMLQEREELDRKVAQHDELVNEIKSLKEKLFHYQTNGQSGTSVSTNPQSLPDDSLRDSDKNELERMKRKYKNLESHNTKLKMQLQQKEEGTKLISDLNEQVKVNILYNTFYIYTVHNRSVTCICTCRHLL